MLNQKKWYVKVEDYNKKHNTTVLLAFGEERKAYIYICEATGKTTVRITRIDSKNKWKTMPSIAGFEANTYQKATEILNNL